MNHPDEGDVPSFSRRQHAAQPITHRSIAHPEGPQDSARFMSAARFLQALWREEKGLPIGVHRDPKGKRRKQGSRLDSKLARRGSNFLSHEIANLAFRESVYRESGKTGDAG